MRQMDTKADKVELTYPYIYFTVENFDEVFDSVCAKEGDCVCVELVAKGINGGCETRRLSLFQGSVSYDALRNAFDSKRNNTTWGYMIPTTKRRVEFLMLRGPHGKGEAQMAVSVQDSSSEQKGTSAYLRSAIGALTYLNPLKRAPTTTGILNTFLTYVNLSWDLIVKDLVDFPNKPVLEKV
eukprot:Colp12_sorted_trinity150504_noHs@10722